MKPFATLGAISVVLLIAVNSAVAAVSSSGVVPCNSEEDCHIKWQRAEQWVRQQSERPIETVNETGIETQREPGRNYSNLYYRITKEMQGKQPVIQFSADCLPSVHCSSDPEEAQKDFNQYVQTAQ